MSKKVTMNLSWFLKNTIIIDFKISRNNKVFIYPRSKMSGFEISQKKYTYKWNFVETVVNYNIFMLCIDLLFYRYPHTSSLDRITLLSRWKSIPLLRGKVSIPVTRQAFQLPVKHSKDDKQKGENLNLILLCIEHGFL